MDPIESLESEQEIIEREILELETIIEDDVINYPNLLHTLKKIYKFWNNHEKKEEEILDILEVEGYSISIERTDFTKGELKENLKQVLISLNLNSEYLLKQSLQKQGLAIISKIKNHLEEERWAFCMIDWSSITPRSTELIKTIQTIPISYNTNELKNQITKLNHYI